jgi:TldD protein
LRAEVDRGPKSYGIQELVLRSPSGAPILEAFTTAFDRAETRAAIASVPPRGLSCAVFAPGVCGIVAHELIGHALEGDVVVRGPTWITQAESLASVRPLTVLDDPRRGRGAWTIDDEGVEARETILVEDGRQVGLLLDRASANALGKLPTGHGRRASYLDAVRARMGCTVIMSGSDDPTEILRSTRSGVYVRRLVGGDTDPRSGRASFLVSDSDRIDGGRIAEPFGPFILELDGQTSWSSIDRVGDDFELDTCIGTCIREGQPIVVSVGAPTIRIGVVTVSS